MTAWQLTGKLTERAIKQSRWASWWSSSARFAWPESVMAAFTTGKPLDLTTADYPSLHQRGRILRVSPVIDPASGSVQVIGEAVHPSPLLKPGMQMQVHLAP